MSHKKKKKQYYSEILNLTRLLLEQPTLYPLLTQLMIYSLPNNISLPTRTEPTLLKKSENHILAQEINTVHRFPKLKKCIQWPYLRTAISEVVNKLLDYMIHNQLSRPKLPMTSANVYLVMMILIGAFC